MNWRETLLCIFLFLLAYFIWQQLDTDSDSKISTAANNQTLLGYYLKDTELVRYDADGQQTYKIIAQTIEQNRLLDKNTDKVQNKYQFSNIEIIYSNPVTNEQWSITADKASMPESRQQINFSGNVKASSLGDVKTSLTTDSLLYDIDKQILNTDAAIKAQSNNRSITAKGMTLNLVTERLKLHANVHARIKL